MNWSATPASAPNITSPSGGGATRLQGRRLLLVRCGWLALVALTMVVFGGSVPLYLTQLRTIASCAACSDAKQLTPDSAYALAQLGISASEYAALGIVFVVMTACVWFSVALVIVWRKSDEWMALLVALLLVMLGANNLASPVQSLPSFWQFPSLLLSYLAFVLLVLVFSLFPTGHFVPSWTRWLVVVWTITLFPGYFGTFPAGALPVLLLAWISQFLCLLVAQAYRYRRISSLVQRQQTKWVVLGVGVVLLFEVVTSLLNIFFPTLSQSGSLASLLFAYSIFFVPILIPISIGIALLRYRLWDVDALINKALVYGLLSASLGALYAGLIIGLESLVGVIGGHALQPLVLVISTLAIATLFLPVRRRIQAVIDRRFYRERYDAEKTLASFSATLQSEVDLQELREHLVAVVQHTMQPSQVFLWLWQPEGRATELLHSKETLNDITPPTRGGLPAEQTQTTNALGS